jgi:hypothetical protein
VTAPEADAARDAFEVTAALVSTLANTATVHGARTVLLTMGSGTQPCDGLSTPEARAVLERLTRVALAAGFSEALALSPLLRRHGGADALFFPEDGHWTAAGTRLVAPAVADAIARTAARRF